MTRYIAALALVTALAACSSQPRTDPVNLVSPVPALEVRDLDGRVLLRAQNGAALW